MDRVFIRTINSVIMNRRAFLQKLGVGVAVAAAGRSIVKAVVPEVAPARMEELPDYTIYTSHLDAEYIDHLPPEHAHEWAKRRYPMRVDECYRSQWHDLAEREFFRPIWPKFVEKYENVSIFDFLTKTM